MGSNAKSVFHGYLFWLCAAIVVTLLLATAMGFCLAALYLYLIGLLAPTFAALITAAGALLLGGLLVFFAWFACRFCCVRAGGAHKSRKASAQGGEALNSVLLSLATEWIASNAKKASLAGLLAGVLAGASPELRRLLIKVLREATSSE